MLRHLFFSPSSLYSYQYYLQLKKDILEGRVPCSIEQAIRLAGLAVQGMGKLLMLAELEPSKRTFRRWVGVGRGCDWTSLTRVQECVSGPCFNPHQVSLQLLPSRRISDTAGKDISGSRRYWPGVSIAEPLRSPTHCNQASSAGLPGISHSRKACSARKHARSLACSSYAL